MVDFNLDNPGDVRWLGEYGPAPVVGPCPHHCARHHHHGIAWGPDFNRYTLAECRGYRAGGPSGCGCRAWLDGWGNEVTAWLQVGAGRVEAATR